MTSNMLSSRRLRIAAYYCAAAGLFFVLALTADLLCTKYRDSLALAVDTLQKARLNLAQAGDTNRLVDSSLAGIKAIVPPGVFANPPETVLLQRIDDMKENARSAEIVVQNIGRKPDEVSLPVQIKSEMKDYTEMVNTVGYLESLRFPFFSISGVSIAQSSYEIKGTLRMPKKQ